MTSRSLKDKGEDLNGGTGVSGKESNWGIKEGDGGHGGGGSYQDLVGQLQLWHEFGGKCCLQRKGGPIVQDV